MSDRRDDEALSWAGDDDPTLDPQGVRSTEPRLAPGWSVVGKPGEAEVEAPEAEAPETEAPETEPRETEVPETVFAAEVETSETDPAAGLDAAPGSATAESSNTPDAPREQMSSPMLITLGVFGGVFLLYAVGWAVSAFRPDATPPTDVVGSFMFNLGQVLAVLAAPVWMAATLWLTRPKQPWFRIAMLAVGIVVLIPWPFLRGV